MIRYHIILRFVVAESLSIFTVEEPKLFLGAVGVVDFCCFFSGCLSDRFSETSSRAVWYRVIKCATNVQ